MATRTISTKIAIEGETQYRASLKNINSEIKTLQSALKLTESQYQTNANSMAALTAKGAALNNLYEAQETKVKELRTALENAKSAERSYTQQKEELGQKIEANNRALEELKNTAGDTSEEQERLTSENKKLNEELDKCEANLEASSKGVNNWQTQLNNAEIKLNDLDAELKLNDKYLDEARQSTDGCATSINNFGDKVKESAKASDTLKNALMSAGVIAALKATAEALKDCAEESIKYESAMAGVAKTTDLTEAELENMGEAIKELSTKIPATATEIANVTEAAGQLGIAKDDLLAFSEVMVNLGVTTNLSSTEAASALAKFANVVGMSSDSYEALGSTIVALGNNFATTEADIVSMATRLASSGSIVGLTESQIMAVAAALSSVGIEAEAGGSAVSKLLKQFETMVQTGSPKLTEFATIAGMSAEEFSTAWGNNAVEALSLFINGLGRVDDAGGSSVAVLEELGITEVRLSNAVLALASSNGILNNALTTANSAWADNTALVKEASTRYETTESKLQLLSNAFSNVKIALGDQLSPALGDFADAGADALNWAADMIEQNEWLAPTLTATATAVGILAAAILSYNAVTQIAQAVTEAFNAILKGNSFYLVASAITAVVSGLVVLLATLPEVESEYDKLSAASKAQYDHIEELNASYKRTCEVFGETSVEAQLLKQEIEKETAAFEKNKKTTEEVETAHREAMETHKDFIASYKESSESLDKEEQSTRALVIKLEELTKKEHKTAETKQEILAVVGLLNEAIPELGLVYDQYADSLNIAEKGIRAVIEAEIARERYTADYENLKTAIAEQDALYQDMLTATENLNAAQMELEAAIAARDARLQELNATNSESGGREYAVAMKEYALAVQEAQAQVDSLSVIEQEASSAYKENQEIVDQLTGSLGEYNATLAETAESSAYNTTAITEKINELAQSYRDAYDAAYSSISGQVGLFDEFVVSVTEDTRTVEEMMGIWSEQTKNLATYTENLKLAAQYGLDEGLILSLSDGSVESAAHLQVIIDEINKLGGSTESMSADAQKFVDDFNESFRSTEEAKDSFAKTVAGIETELETAISSLEKEAAAVDFTGFTTALESAFSNVGVDFKSIGKDAGSGLATGIESTKNRVESASKDLAQGGIDSLRNTLDSHSDSRVTIEIGKDFVGGMVTGIESREDELVSVTDELAEEVSDTITDAATDMVNAYVKEFSKLPTQTRTKLTELKSTITSTTSSLPGAMTSIGQQMVNGMINGLYNRSSSLYYTVRSIVNTAISNAKSAAATASPSKKTTAIFEDVGEGMVVGLENKRHRIAQTAQSVVNEALTLNASGKIETAIADIDDRMPQAKSRGSGGNDNRTYKIENNFQIEKVEVRDDSDIERIAEELYMMEQKELRKRGVKM